MCRFDAVAPTEAYNNFVCVNFLVNFVFKYIDMANRNVIFYKHYFQEFLVAQTPQVRKKIAQVLVWISTIDRLPVTIFKSIQGVSGLFEIRIEFGGNIFRVFCCLDEGELVVLFNGFQKKSQKTPTNEIEKATRIMNDYFREKKNG